MQTPTTKQSEFLKLLRLAINSIEYDIDYQTTEEVIDAVFGYLKIKDREIYADISSQFRKLINTIRKLE